MQTAKALTLVSMHTAKALTLVRSFKGDSPTAVESDHRFVIVVLHADLLKRTLNLTLVKLVLVGKSACERLDNASLAQLMEIQSPTQLVTL